MQPTRKQQKTKYKLGVIAIGVLRKNTPKLQDIYYLRDETRLFLKAGFFTVLGYVLAAVCQRIWKDSSIPSFAVALTLQIPFFGFGLYIYIIYIY